MQRLWFLFVYSRCVPFSWTWSERHEISWNDITLQWYYSIHFTLINRRTVQRTVAKPASLRYYGEVIFRRALRRTGAKIFYLAVRQVCVTCVTKSVCLRYSRKRRRGRRRDLCGSPQTRGPLNGGRLHTTSTVFRAKRMWLRSRSPCPSTINLRRWLEICAC